MSFETDPLYERLRPYLASDLPNANGWFDAFCPMHDDTKRSAGFNFDKGIWSCRVNCGSGDLLELVRRLDSRDDNDFVAGGWEDEPSPIDSPFVDQSDAEIIDLQSARRTRRRQNRPSPTQEDIESWMERLYSDDELLARFSERRSIHEHTLRRFEIGWSDEDRAYTIPIKDPDGLLMNVRLYRIEEQATKIWSFGSPGMDANAIFPESILKEHDEILLCEGEWDALLANQEGFPAVTGTTGAEQWQAKWNRKFTNKDVFICYDRDRAGERGAEKVARNLSDIARSVRIVQLPLEWREKDGMDITDFFKMGHVAKELHTALDAAEHFVPPKDGPVTDVTVQESFVAGFTGKPMSLVVSVVGKQSPPHLLPKNVVFNCGMNADKACHGCPMFDANGHIAAEIPASDPVILRMRDVTDKVRDEELREFIGAHKCGKMEMFIKDFQTTELLSVRTSIDHNEEEEGEAGKRAVINVGSRTTQTNRIVRLIGTTHPSPKEQHSTFQAWQLDEVESSLDAYEVTAEAVSLMKVFQPAAGQSPLKKLGEIARDLSQHVTFIIGDERVDLHIAMDLVFHSVISFDFGGQRIERGWLELLVVGDARTGKSEVATKLTRHHQLGRVVSCESASIPGLLAAVKQLPGGKGWSLEWGAIPLNDRRLLVMDEAAGLSPEQISQLSSVRSSGRAEVYKAEREITNARTRLIWLSNPRFNQFGMRGFHRGVDAIAPLIGNQEDIARFDFAMTVQGADVESEEINRRIVVTDPQKYTSEACHALVLWAWSRKPEDIEWELAAEELVYQHAVKLGKEFVPNPPLIQAQNVRQKIARMAVAVAARLFSTDETHTRIVVKTEHVLAAVKFLRFIYNRPGFGYGELSRRARNEEKSAASMVDEAERYLHGRAPLARFLSSCDGHFRRQQLEEILNIPRDEANVIINRLASMSMIASTTDWDYRVLPILFQVLRNIEQRGD